MVGINCAVVLFHISRYIKSLSGHQTNVYWSTISYANFRNAKGSGNWNFFFFFLNFGTQTRLELPRGYL